MNHSRRRFSSFNRCSSIDINWSLNIIFYFFSMKVNKNESRMNISFFFHIFIFFGFSFRNHLGHVEFPKPWPGLPTDCPWALQRASCQMRGVKSHQGCDTEAQGFSKQYELMNIKQYQRKIKKGQTVLLIISIRRRLNNIKQYMKSI